MRAINRSHPETFDDKRPIIYVSGPMTADDGWKWEQNIRRAEHIGFELIGEGASPVVPQTMGRMFRETYDYQTWMDNDISLLRMCHGMVLIPGWVASKGANDEKTYADANHINTIVVPNAWDWEEVWRAKVLRPFLAQCKEQ